MQGFCLKKKSITLLYPNYDDISITTKMSAMSVKGVVCVYCMVCDNTINKNIIEI